MEAYGAATPGPPTMDAHRKHVRGIVDELMNNAIKAGATQIDVQVQMLEGEISIWVKDNGSGMSAERLAYVKKNLDRPRRDELEEYYGALAGESMVGTGLSLVGMMTDRSEVWSEKGKGTEIRLYRKTED